MIKLFLLRFVRKWIMLGFVLGFLVTCVICLFRSRQISPNIRLNVDDRLQVTSHSMDQLYFSHAKPELGTVMQLKKPHKTNTPKTDYIMHKDIKAIANVQVKHHPTGNVYSKYHISGKKKSKSERSLLKNEQTLQLFNNSITLDDKHIFEELIKTFVKIAREYKLEYFLCCGSLLGSYRHHGMMPWDDDMDVMMNSSHKEAIESAFQYSGVLTLDRSTTFRWRVYFNSSHPVKGYWWKWPFIDLIFFKENSTHYWYMDSKYATFCFRKSWLFPTVSRPFWDLWLPAPRDTESVLKNEYNVEECATPFWNHKLETHKEVFPPRIVPCRSLYGRVAFVQREKLNASNIIETLYLGNRTLSAVLIKKP